MYAMVALVIWNINILLLGLALLRKAAVGC